MPRAHYISPYEKDKKERAEILRATERRKFELFSSPCQYNLQHRYQLNPNNLVINKFYNGSKLGRPPFGDLQRRVWEDCLWNILRRQYMKYDCKNAKGIPVHLPSDEHISNKLMGWRLEYFELFVNNAMDISAALKDFAENEEMIDYGKCN